MELRTEKVFFSKHKAKIKDIYFSSFPVKERMAFSLMIAMSCLWNTEFNAYYDGETLCGFIYSATIGKQTFIMFFAVDEKLRNKGYGGAILDEVQKMHPDNKIIVSIEPCIEGSESFEICERRRAFYLRNDFNETGYLMELGGSVQEVLIRNGEFDKFAFKRFFMLYSNLTVIPKIWKK